MDKIIKSRKCNHPDHDKILEEYTKRKSEPITNVYIETPKYGVVCGNCWSYEMGAIVEKHPVNDNV